MDIFVINCISIVLGFGEFWFLILKPISQWCKALLNGLFKQTTRGCIYLVIPDGMNIYLEFFFINKSTSDSS